ncbi:hypothetical protein EJ04DRAFT_570943 [Polyplosphaeria fusca]|uniref:Uncharacterized protein n=1 Tax=Polyplosphaeria fusca TaxID=682080 RepID=A0A9P4QL19_9PLEO|nr:hypothetical protein EJ04DRAFT_570943 [Polyplosphaeria fusca]
MPKITVEVVDTEVAHQSPPLKEITSSQGDILEVSRHLLPKIMSQISNRQWITIDILNWYHPTSRSHHPTVVISARDASDDVWWSSTLPAIYEIIEENSSSLKVVLLFLDCLDFSTNSPTSFVPTHKRIEAHYYDEDLLPGTSCGRDGSDESGTLGGFVVVDKGGEQIRLGLTNCHVLLQDSKLDLKETIGPCPALEELMAVSPSDADHELFTRKMQNYISIRSKKLERLEQAYSEGELSQSVKDRIEKRREKLKSKRSKLAKAKAHDRILGSVYATSGFTTWPPIDHSNASRSWALDWCLIRLQDKLRLKNLPEDVPQDVEIKNTVPIRFWARFSKYDKYEVLKRGRSTEWTRGTINRVNSWINPVAGLPQLHSGESTGDQLTIPGFFDNKPMTAHTIVSEQNLPQNSQFFTEFTEKGDSGSFVLLNKKVDGPQEAPPGTILGLFFANNDYVSYMIPIELVVKSISAVTGGNVVQPQEWTSSICTR